MKRYLILLLILPLCSFKREPLFPKVKHLKPYWHKSIRLEEPSDICLSPTNPGHYFIVSNRGSIAEIDSTGKVLRRTKYDGSDYESICIKDSMIYVIDESLRRVDVVDPKDFTVKKSMSVPFSGGRNKGMEGLVYIPSQKKFISVIEKPAGIIELNEQMQNIGQIFLKQFSELSAITYYKDYLWLLSDEDHEVMKVNPVDYSIIDRWSVPVVNPEGIAFDTDGTLLILSDDMSTLYKIKMP